ncbi:MAG: hypothetical protein AB7P03_00715 [Kofleriaceae bacterium]
MTDASHLALVMTVSPNDGGTMGFGPGLQYVFHVAGSPSYVAGQAGTETRVICMFASPSEVTCWVDGPSGLVGSVTGDPQGPEGITGLGGKFRVFAGRRSDPSFGNLAGLRAGVQMVKGVSQDVAGCPTDESLSDTMFASVGTAPATAQPLCPAGSVDCFADSNVLALAIELDASLITTVSEPIAAVWASTHAKP